MDRQQFEQTTRTVFDEIHRAQGDDQAIFKRLTGLLNTEYLGVSNDWFAGKTCLDAGCGSNANATYSMLSMGAAKVYAFDLDPGSGETVLDTVPKYLNEFVGRYELRLSNVLDMDYADNSFDFSNCAGVLHHTADLYQGMRELARVTKPGGTIYMLINGRGGLIRDITNLLRDKYEEDAEFRFFMDSLNEERFGEIASWISSEMAAHDDDMGEKVSMALLKTLFDQDLVLTIKDRIAAPVYHEFSEEEILEWLQSNGFSQVKRLSRYPRYDNVRRFLSPLYNSYGHELSKMLFGSGQMGIKAIKDAS